MTSCPPARVLKWVLRGKSWGVPVAPLERCATMTGPQRAREVRSIGTTRCNRPPACLPGYLPAYLPCRRVPVCLPACLGAIAAVTRRDRVHCRVAPFRRHVGLRATGTLPVAGRSPSGGAQGSTWATFGVWLWVVHEIVHTHTPAPTIPLPTLPGAALPRSPRLAAAASLSPPHAGRPGAGGRRHCTRQVSAWRGS